MTRYRIPTHLSVEPSLLRAELGPLPVDLTFRQATILAFAAGFMYWLWQGSGWPLALTSTLTAIAGLLALTLAFVTIGGRPADRWLRAALHYAARPHRLVWRAVATPVVESSSSSARVGPPLTVAWAPPTTSPSPAEPAPASD